MIDDRMEQNLGVGKILDLTNIDRDKTGEIDRQLDGHKERL